MNQGTTGIGALGGAIIGGTLCTSFASVVFGPSYGIAGAVFGIIMGAIYGNDFEKSV